MQYASNVLHLHQIYAIVAESNQNAVKILEVVGFQGDKLLKGWLKTGSGYEDAYFFNLFVKYSGKFGGIKKCSTFALANEKCAISG